MNFTKSTIPYLSITLCTNLLVSKDEYAAGSTSRHRLKNFTCFLQTKSSLKQVFFSFSVSILCLWLPKYTNLLHVSDTDVPISDVSKESALGMTVTGFPSNSRGWRMTNGKREKKNLTDITVYSL